MITKKLLSETEDIDVMSAEKKITVAVPASFKNMVN